MAGSEIQIKVPQMGESVAEGTVADWHFEIGQAFNEGDILVELETDKVTVEIPAPTSGTLTSIFKKRGETVIVGTILANMNSGAAPATAPVQTPATAAPAPAAVPVATSAPAARNETLPPGARRLVAENNLDPAGIPGTGKQGQVTKTDVLQHLESGGAKKNPAPVAPRPRAPITVGEREKIVPMSRLRQKIAERLVAAQQTAAILTTFNEIDMSNVMAIRSRYKDQFKEKYGVGLGFMSFFTKAVIRALHEVPEINAEIRGIDVIYKNYFDIGVAVGGPKGLVVPIIRDADRMSFWEIEAEITRLAGRVKEGSISLEEMQDGTFTISNGGIYGSMMSTPIINPPQSGILGMHNITKRAVVVNDEIVIRPMMYVALSYDHRIVDGKGAVTFLVRVKECIENPERLLLEV